MSSQVHGLFISLVALANLDRQRAAADDGQLVLADLVALGQVGVEVALAGKDVVGLDFAAQGQGHAQRELHGAAVDDRQHPRHTQADRTDGRVRRGGHAIDDATAAEHLRVGQEFGVGFQADDGFVLLGHVAAPALSMLSLLCGGSVTSI